MPPDRPPDREAPLFAAFKALVVERTRIAYHGGGDGRLRRALQARLDALGMASLRDYLDRLGDGERGRAEMDRLREALVVGESYFFRHVEQLEALCEVALPERLTGLDPGRGLSVWSAGCASGPEPYSLCILLRERLAGCALEVLGTDVDRSALAAAEVGLYDPWCLRATPAAVVERCFVAEGGRYRLNAAWRAGVRFACHDLTAEPFAAPSSGGIGFDAVLCRNVLIYFDRTTAEGVAAALAATLRPGGWLVLGHSEWDLAPAALERVPVGSVMLFRRPAGVGADRLSPRAPPWPSPPRMARARPACASTAPPPPRSSSSPADAPSRRVAAPPATETEPLDPLTYLARALRAAERDETVEMERMLRRCLYLDPACALAHLHLGGLLLRAGRAAEARRRLLTASRLLDGADEAAPLPGGEGLTVGEAMGAVQSFVARLPA